MLIATRFLLLGAYMVNLGYCNMECDIVFCIDTSDGVEATTKMMVQDAISTWADYWGVNPTTGVNMGIILYGHRAQSLFSLSDRYSLNQIKKRVLNYNGPKGFNALGRCLRKSITMGEGYFADSTRDIMTRQYMVIFTTRNSNDRQDTDNQISELRSRGVTVITIALGMDDNYELQNSQTDHFFHLQNTFRLTTNLDVRNTICPVQCQGITYNANTQKCCNGQIIAKNAACQEFCNGLAFNPSTQKCCEDRIVNINQPCGVGVIGQSQIGQSQLGQNQIGQSQIGQSQIGQSQFGQSQPCVSSTWYRTQNQCDSRSRCVDGVSGIITTKGCGCNQFANSQGQCLKAAGLTCVDDPCKANGVTAWKYHNHDLNMCRAYWKCNMARKVTIPHTRCCQPWETFNPIEQRCVLDIYETCKEPCTCRTLQLPRCMKFPDETDPTYYYEAIRESIGKYKLKPRYCRNGQFFYNIPESNSCECRSPNLMSLWADQSPATNTTGANNGTSSASSGESSDSSVMFLDTGSASSD